VGTFGDRLKREREMRGISLDEISHSTKIGTRLLKALEEEDFQKLPGGIFNKGFVRAYAKFLGIDEEEAVADYMVVAGEDSRAVVNPEQLRKAVEKKVSEKKAPTPPLRPVPAAGDDSSAPPNWLPVVAFLLLGIALAAGAVHLYRRHNGHIRGSVIEKLDAIKNRFSRSKKPVSGPQNSPTMTVAADSVAATSPAASSASPADTALPKQQISPASTSTQPSTEKTLGISGTFGKTGDYRSTLPSADIRPESGSGPFESGTLGEFALLIRAREPSWISFVSDENPPIRRLLRPGDPATIKARTRIKLTVGNAGGLDLSIDGKPQPAIGASNQVKTVFVTSSGVQP
jgi:cytoskeleton protein RodZ